MKILCISDHVDPLVYSPNIKQRFKEIDLILSSGDLRFKYYDYILTNLNKQLLFVFGNHNLIGITHFKKRFAGWNDYNKLTYDTFEIYGGTHVGGKVIKIKNLIIAGLGGSMRYNNGLNQYSERCMFFNILRLIPALLWNRIFYGRYLDILVTHAPPFGIHDKPDLCHMGFKVFIWFMKKFKPKYLVHGHVHLYDNGASRRTRYRDTTVVNAYNHTIIEIDNMEKARSKHD